jgi:transcription elongation factor B subunit 1
MEGHEFILDRKCALMSGTIRSMLEGDFIEGSEGKITFQEISTPVLGMRALNLLSSRI